MTEAATVRNAGEVARAARAAASPPPRRAAPPTATPDDARVAQRTHITQGKVLKHYYCIVL